MTTETIVAVYDTQAHADAAVKDLLAAGVPQESISRHGGQTGATGAGMTGTAAPAREQGFWSSLFGGEPEHDTAVYDRSVEAGSSVVTVKSPAEHVEAVSDILERHSPVDMQERAESYGTAKNTAATTGTSTAPARATGTGDQVISLAAEEIAIGKRLIDRGTTRVRRFVVETPVEQDVNLHSERVSVERRAVTGSATGATPEFTDRVVEMTETDEEAVVGKTSRIAEEVVIRKDASDRVETIKDSVRHEDVEITKQADSNRTDLPAKSRI